MYRSKNRFLAIAATMLLTLATIAHADLDEGMSLFKSGKYVEAAAQFQAIVDGAPTYDFGHFMIGNCFLKMNKPGEAVKNLETAIELNGDKFEYHHALAKAHYDQKAYSKTIATLRTVEGLATDSSKKYALYNMRGLSYYNTKKWSDAISDLEEAKKIKSSTTLDTRLGVAYYNMGYYDKANPLLKAAYAKSKSDSTLILLLANANMNLGAEAKSDSQKDKYYGDAFTYAKAYRDAKPSDPEAHNILGRAALGSKEFGTAEQAFRTVLDKDKDHCFAMANLGKTYIAQSKWVDAEKVLNNATQCAPKMVVAYENLGFAIQKQKRYGDAIPVYEKALSIERKPSIQGLIDTCKKNIEILEFNEDQEALDAKQKAEEEAARKEFEEQKRKQEEWKRKREDN